MATGSRTLESAMSPKVAKMAVSASSSGIPAATSEPKVTTRTISVIGSERPRLAEVVVVRRPRPLSPRWRRRTRRSRSPDGHVARMQRRRGPGRSCRPPRPWRRGSGTRRARSARPSRWVRVARGERRADVLDGRDLRDPRDDVCDRRVEGGRACASRMALDQDVLGGGLLEARPRGSVHAAGLARPGGVVDVPRPHRHRVRS